MTDPHLSIRRHDVRIRAVGRPAPADAVAAAVAARLARAPAPDGTGYWVIRSLELHTVVGAQWSATGVADSIARGLSSRLADRVRRGIDPAAALWFPGRAAFVSAFLIDLAAGRARGRWEYGQFADLPADASTAIVALAEREPDALLAGLVRLSDRELADVVTAIAPERVDQIAASLSSGAARAPLRRITGIVADTFHGGRILRGPRGGLLSALIAARDTGGEGLAALTSAGTAAVAVAEAAERAGSERGLLLTAVATGDWELVRRIVGTADFDPILALVPWPVADRAALAEALRARTPPADATPESMTEYTPFGGLFLLLPLLDELWDWRTATLGWPVVGGVPASAVVRLRAVAAALSADDPRVARDGLLRRAFGLGSVGDGELSAAAAALDARHLDAFAGVAGAGDRVDELVARTATALLRSLGARLPGMDAASAAYLRREVLDIDAHVRFEGARAVVELSHPPLGVIVSLSGLNRGSFRMPESEDLTWTLTTRG